MKKLRNKLVDILAELPGISGYSAYGVLRHPIKAFFVYPYLEAKWFIQRGRRGYSDRDAWNLDSYLAKWMPQAIRSLKNGHGFPVNAYTDLFGDTDLQAEWPAERCDAAHKHWQSVLEQIAMGLESARKIQEFDLSDPLDQKFHEARVDNSLNLFKQYFFNLWD